MGRCVPVLALLASLATAGEGAEVSTRTPCRGAERLGALTYLTDGSAGAAASVVACEQAEEVLVEHGWRLPHAIVRIEANPFDATARPAEIALSSAATPADNAFALTEKLVLLSLASSAGVAPVESMARTVAVHLAVPSAAGLATVEDEWLAKVGRGDVLTTVLPELLWRNGGDRALRAAVTGRWPDAALVALRDHGCEDPLDAAGELVLAALLRPALLGFGARPLAPATLSAATRSSDVSLSSPGARFLVLPTGAGALGVEPLRSDEGAAAWLAVRYSLTGDYDVIRLNEAHELAVPLQGVEWAAVVVVSLAPSAHVSLNLRVISDFPQQLARWDFVATPGAASLAWETERHRGLAAYVVEALSRSSDGAWSVAKRVLVPVADDGEEPYGYAFVDPEGDNIAAYRLLALTEEGLLGEVSTFPVPPD
jgi:hypothetical protein